jgi:hypothetical protein
MPETKKKIPPVKRFFYALVYSPLGTTTSGTVRWAFLLSLGGGLLYSILTGDPGYSEYEELYKEYLKEAGANPDLKIDPPKLHIQRLEELLREMGHPPEGSPPH